MNNFFDPDHIDALDMLSEAYALIDSFYEHIESACEGEHPLRQSVLAWLDKYEGEVAWA